MLFLQIPISLLIFTIQYMSIQTTVMKNVKRIQTKRVSLNNRDIPEFFNNTNYEKKENTIKTMSTWDQFASNGIHDEHIKRWNYYKDVKKIYLWSNGIIPFVISTNLSTKEKKLIVDAMNNFHTKTCIVFREKEPNDQNYIEFKKSSYGCWTYIGKMRGRNLMELDSTCINKRSTLLHQLMHVIGFFDQHNAKDRDKWITIIWNNIQVNKKQYFDIPKSSLMEVEFPYDYQSIMHLNMYYYSRNQKETMLSKVPRVNYLGPANNDFTSIDLYKINKLYENECKLRIENIINEINNVNDNNNININGSVFDKPDYQYKRNDEINYLYEDDDSFHNSKYDNQESYYEMDEIKRNADLQNKDKKTNIVPHMICVIWPVSIDTNSTKKRTKKRNVLNILTESQKLYVLNNHDRYRQKCPEI